MTQIFKLNNQKEITKPKNNHKIIFTIILIFIILSIFVTEFNFLTLFTKFDKFLDIIIKMSPPIFNIPDLLDYFSYSSTILPEFILTFQMAIVGTIIGVFLAFWIAIIASQNITNKKIANCTKFILSIIRTLPILIYAMIFAYIFGLGEGAGVIAIIVFSFGIMTKMLYEVIERLDMGAFEAAISSGLTITKAFNLTLLPVILPAFYSLSLYIFEINIRSAAILGYVGAGGIGQQLKDAMSLRQYDKAGLILFYTIIIVMIIDYLTQKIRKEMI